MSERTQRVLWCVLAIIALGLSAATAYLYMQYRRVSETAGAAYRLAYTSIQGESQDTLSGQLQSCDLGGRNAVQLTETTVLDAFAACESLPPGANREPRIAFLRLEFETEPHSGTNDVGVPGAVYVIDAKGNALSRVSGSLERMWTVAPSWAPDGRQLAFAAVEDLNSDGELLVDEVGIYISTIRDAQSTRIAIVGAAVTRLSWSPASPHIIVTSIESGGPVSHLLDAETGSLLLEGPAPAACWSPDGLELAAYLTEDDRIHIVRPDGSESYVLDPPPGQVSQLLWVPMWPASKQTDQGRLLAVSAPEHTSDVGQLYVRSAEPDGKDWERLGSQDDYVMHMAASPDGRYVACTLFTEEPAYADQPVPSADIYLLDISHNQRIRLTAESGFEGLATWISAP